MSVFDFSTMFQNNKNKFFGFAMKLTKNMMDAEDLMQEAFIKAYRSKDKFQPGTNFNAWFNSIIKNTFISDLRKKIVRNVVSEPVESINIIDKNLHLTEKATSNMEYENFDRILQTLNEDQKIPFSMHLEGFLYEEISDILNVPIGTIKSRIFYAKNYLRKALTRTYNTTDVNAIRAIIIQ